MRLHRPLARPVPARPAAAGDLPAVSIERDIGLGYGWTHAFAFSIEARRRTATIWKADGEAAEVPVPEVGGHVALSDGWVLSRGEDGFRLVDDRDIVRFFHDRDRHGARYRLSAVIDRNGNQIGLVYSGARLAALIDSAGRTVRVRYGRDGRIAAFEVKNSAHQGTWISFFTYTYDDKGDLVGVTDAEGNVTEFAYDDHRLVQEQRPGGLRAVFRYDAAGRCVETWCDFRGGPDPSLDDDVPELLADGRTKAKGFLHCAIEYGPDGYVEVADSRQVRRVFTNPFGKIDKATIGAAVFSHTYDERGLETSYTDPLGATTYYQRDSNGRLMARIDPLGRSTTYSYHPNGDVASITAPNGSTVYHEHDDRGNLLSARDDLGNIIQFHYDARGLVERICFPNGGVARFSYDAFGNRTEVVEPDGATKQIAYDYLGRPVRLVDARGLETRYTYDDRGRRIGESLTVAGKTYALASTFDAMNARIRRQSSLGHDERIARDVRGRPVRVLLGGTEEVVSTWDLAGRESARYLPGGAIIQTARGVMNDVERRTVFAGGAPPFPGAPAAPPVITVDKGYRYNLSGEILEEWDRTFGALQYQLDAIGQLTARIPQSGLPELFTYDEAQNLHEATPGSARRDYARGGRCERANGAIYRYDGDARLVEKRVPRADGGEDVWRYSWTARGLLKAVERPDGAIVEFGYDGFDRRVFKRVRPSAREAPRSTTTFVWDHIQLLHEITERAAEEGDPVVEERTYAFSHETLEPVAHRDVTIQGGARDERAWVYYVTNPVDAPEHIVSRSGELLASIELGAFGEARPRAGAKADTALRFRGQYADAETGLHYNWSRYYDPSLKQYISADPIGVEGGIRPFGYVGNRPRTSTDPFGLNDPVTTTVTLTNSSTITGHSQGYYTNNGGTGMFSGGGGTLPSTFPDLNNGRGTLPNQCGECDSLNRHFGGLDPENPAHRDEIRRRAQQIQNIEPTRDSDGRVLPPCRYCTQRMARLSEVSGVNLFNKLTPPDPPRRNPFTNIRDPAQRAAVAAGAPTPGTFPYTIRSPGNQIIRADGTPVNAV